MTQDRRFTRLLDGDDPVSPPFSREEELPDDPAGAVDLEVAKRLEQGYREGLQRAADEFQAEVVSFRQQVAATLKELSELEDRLTRQHEERLLEVVIETASRIVRDRVASDDPVAARALKDAVEALPRNVGVRARMHPDDLQLCSTELEQELASGRIELVADETIHRGGCVVESTAGTVDAQVETAERSARSALLDQGDLP